MKKLFFSYLILVLYTTSFAQEIRSEMLEDSVIGWMKIYNFKGTNKPLTVDHRTYTAAQLSICDSFVNWMQASYMPKGALGDVKKTVMERLGPYNQYTAAMPQRYGAVVKTYTELKRNANGKLEPFTNSHLVWRMMANEIVGTGINALCTPSKYYFTMPSFAEQGYDGEYEKKVDLSAHPVLGKYASYYQRNRRTGNEKYIILYKEKSPFVKVTKGEYLQAMEAAVLKLYETKKQEIYNNPGNNQKQIDYFMKYLNEAHAKRLECLKNNKEKYKDRLGETAEVSTVEPNALLENIPDVFEGTGGSGLKLPVYKVDPVIAEQCKTNQPQWIVVAWTTALNDPIGKHMYDAVINNFNFDYVYNFFFDPEKVKGQAYKPLRSLLYKEAVAVTEASETKKKNTADKNVIFFDDFSTTATGKKPTGWQTKLTNDGQTAIVVYPDGLEDTWAQLRGHQMNLFFTKSLPQNFTFTYDIAAAQNFTWGAKALTMQLSYRTTAGRDESYLLLKLRPGFDGRDGEAELETKFPYPPGYSNGIKWYKAYGFSNNKKANKVTVTIKKKEELLQVFIDNTKIAEYEKAIPLAHPFNALSFSSSGNSAETDTYFISNIKIVKE